jgi:hypothetical protein
MNIAKKFCNLQAAERFNGDAISGHRNVNERAKNSWWRYLSSTTTKWQFTTYERDAESGNDYAMARVYINRCGRRTPGNSGARRS